MVISSNFANDKNAKISQVTYSFLPNQAVIPFTQDCNAECASLVAVGDKVTEGQLIAKSENLMGSTVHSSVPGTVIALEQCSLPNGKISMAARIALGGEFTFLAKNVAKIDYSLYPGDTLKRKIAECGIVNTIYTPQALSFQIQEIKNDKPHFLFVRLFDEDYCLIPKKITASIHTRRRLSLSAILADIHLECLLESSLMLARTFSCAGLIFVCIQKDCEEKIKALIQNIAYDMLVTTIKCDSDTYPQGTKTAILRTLKKGKDAANFSTAGVNDLFIDALTAYNVYQAIAKSKPSIEAYVYVTGSAIKSSGVFCVKVGTLIRDLVAQCGGFVKAPCKIIVNGTMTGYSIASLDIPITKYVKSLQFITKNEDADFVTSDCVRCGECRAVCPEKLFPDILYRHWTREFISGDTMVKSALLCSECSLCNSVCPSRLPLSQVIGLIQKDLTSKTLKEDDYE